MPTGDLWLECLESWDQPYQGSVLPTLGITSPLVPAECPLSLGVDFSLSLALDASVSTVKVVLA